jgi:predicted transposase/invertase (TIGR01784 family)
VKRKSDTRYTELFSNPVFVQRLFESFVKEDFARELDFSDMEPYKTKFVTEAFARRESDVIWKVRFKGKDLYIFLLIEFQSTVDRRIPIRLFHYLAGLYDSLPTPRRGVKCPAVFPLVLYNGSEPWSARSNIAELIQPSIPPEYIPNLRYYVIEERMFSASTLLSMRNLVSLLFYAETVSPAELALSLDTFFGILESEDTEAVQLFRYWLNDYLHQMAHEFVGEQAPELESGEDQAMLAENFRIWRDKVFEEGLEKGVEKGVEKGMKNGIERGQRSSTRKIARKLIAQGMPLESVAATTDLGIDQLKDLLSEE